MEAIHSPLPVYVLAVSLIAAGLIRLSKDRPNLREFWTIGAALVKFSLVLMMLPHVLAGQTFSYHLVTVFPGLDIAFRVDPLGIFFALTASLLWIITSFYSIGYVRALDEHAQTRYFTAFAVTLSATMGVAFSANLFTSFIFYEIITLCTFPLVAHKETPEAIRGARRYLIYLLGTSIAFQLPAIFLTYTTAGTLDFAAGGIMAGKGPDTLITIIFILFMAGIAKAALMPFHSWLPAAMVAPTPVSALLHAVAVVKTGVFMILRVLLDVFGVDLLGDLGLGTALAYAASFTIIVSSVIALRQDNLKARLAYSTVSQLSYVILGAALLTPAAVTGGVMHIVLHAFGKITLFFTAGAIYVAAHKTNISELDGIGRSMPFTMTAFTIGALSMIGIPPLGGFLSKWYIILGAVEAGEFPILLVLVASTILNACYFLPIVYAAFFKPPQVAAPARSNPGHGHEEEHHVYWPWKKIGLREAPILMVAALTFTALGTILLFFTPSGFLALARMIAGG